MIKDRAYYDSLTQTIIGCAFQVGNTLGCGFLEKIYENALVIELRAGTKISDSALKWRATH